MSAPSTRAKIPGTPLSPSHDATLKNIRVLETKLKALEAKSNPIERAIGDVRGLHPDFNGRFVIDIATKTDGLYTYIHQDGERPMKPTKPRKPTKATNATKPTESSIDSTRSPLSTSTLVNELVKAEETALQMETQLKNDSFYEVELIEYIQQYERYTKNLAMFLSIKNACDAFKLQKDVENNVKGSTGDKRIPVRKAAYASHIGTILDRDVLSAIGKDLQERASASKLRTTSPPKSPAWIKENDIAGVLNGTIAVDSLKPQIEAEKEYVNEFYTYLATLRKQVEDAEERIDSTPPALLLVSQLEIKKALAVYSTYYPSKSEKDILSERTKENERRIQKANDRLVRLKHLIEIEELEAIISANERRIGVIETLVAAKNNANNSPNNNIFYREALLASHTRKNTETMDTAGLLTYITQLREHIAKQARVLEENNKADSDELTAQARDLDTVFDSLTDGITFVKPFDEQTSLDSLFNSTTKLGSYVEKRYKQELLEHRPPLEDMRSTEFDILNGTGEGSLFDSFHRVMKLLLRQFVTVYKEYPESFDNIKQTIAKDLSIEKDALDSFLAILIGETKELDGLIQNLAELLSLFFITTLRSIDPPPSLKAAVCEDGFTKNQSQIFRESIRTLFLNIIYVVDSLHYLFKSVSDYKRGWKIFFSEIGETTLGKIASLIASVTQGAVSSVIGKAAPIWNQSVQTLNDGLEAGLRGKANADAFKTFFTNLLKFGSYFSSVVINTGPFSIGSIIDSVLLITLLFNINDAVSQAVRSRSLKELNTDTSYDQSTVMLDAMKDFCTKLERFQTINHETPEWVAPIMPKEIDGTWNKIVQTTATIGVGLTWIMNTVLFFKFFGDAILPLTRMIPHAGPTVKTVNSFVKWIAKSTIDARIGKSSLGYELEEKQRGRSVNASEFNSEVNAFSSLSLSNLALAGSAALGKYDGKSKLFNDGSGIFTPLDSYARIIQKIDPYRQEPQATKPADAVAVAVAPSARAIGGRHITMRARNAHRKTVKSQ